MKGILIIAHGSRAKETETTLENIIETVKEKLPETIIEIAFMEFSDRTVERGISALAAKGITEIKIVPYFLFMGIHLKEDIPNMAEESAKKHPNIKITMAAPLGTDKRLAEIIIDRIVTDYCR